jgi:hypothetical protein
MFGVHKETSQSGQVHGSVGLELFPLQLVEFYLYIFIYFCNMRIKWCYQEGKFYLIHLEIIKPMHATVI